MAREMKDSGVEWIGEIPIYWGITSLKHLCKMQAGKTLSSEQIAQEGQYPVYGGNGIRGFYKEFNNEGLYLLIGRQGALSGNIHKVEGKFWATEHAVLVCICNVCDINFMYYLLMGMNLNQYASNTAAQPGLAVSTIINVKTCIPPINEQQKIAKFLDEKYTELNNVLEKTRASIEEYKKLKQAVITQAVTKGIRGDREMKDSGIVWIGEIPIEWEVSQVKYSLKWKSDKGQPHEEVLSLYRDYGIVPKDSRDDNHNVTSLDTSGYKVVDIGDFVINKMKAWQGSMAVSEYKGIISPAYHVCVFTNGKLNKKYFHYLMRSKSYIPEYTRLSTGMRVGQWDLGFDDFKNIPFLLPPQEEQQEIVNYLDEKCSAIDELIAKKEQYLSEIENYKKSLIYEYVTGKKEVSQNYQASNE